ncbi:MAG: cation:proton antiporter [bacterium]
MMKRSTFEALALYFLEIGALFAALFFVKSQTNFPAVAGALTVALIPILAFYGHRLEKNFRVPYFIWTIGLGYLFKDYLAPLTSSLSLMAFTVTILGVLIIFGGGLEIKLASFKKLLLPIISLSVLGAVLTALLMSLGLLGAKIWLGLPLTVGTIGLLGAMLCSTDPAAIVPVLKRLKLKNKNDATIAISESAVNDVVGTIITAIFAGLVITSTGVQSLGELYRHLFSLAVGLEFIKEIAIGVTIGYLSYSLLKLWKSAGVVSTASFPFFIGVALTAYTLSSLWGGSGYLAAFITGLFFEVGRDFKDIEHLFVSLTDGFVKPAIFVILGALITPAFFKFAGLGIALSLFFMFVVRPIVVFISLFFWSGKNKPFSFRDLLFLDVVRETGVIPAVLLVAYSSKLPDGSAAFAIGSWVILSSLIILPIITEPWVKKMKLASS